MLPRNRGRAPVNWAMLRGEPSVGNTLMFLAAAADEGDVIDQQPVLVSPDDSCGTVYRRVGEVGAELLRRHLPALLAGRAPARRQPAGRRPPLPKRTPEMGITDWARPPRAVHDWIRALSHPYPGAFGHLDGHRVVLWRSRVPGPAEPAGPAGTLLGEDGTGVRVGTGGGSIVLEVVSDPDGPDEPAADWFRRHGLAAGDRFDPVDPRLARWALGLDPVVPSARRTSATASGRRADAPGPMTDAAGGSPS
jgi:methionyl-tRNA formyltransferase